MTNEGLSLALDLGTTTLVGRLLDERGEVLGERRELNPQTGLAADIIRRLELARSGQAAELQQRLVKGVEELTAGLLHSMGAAPQSLRAAAVAANPGTAHLLAAEPVDRLLFPPHRPTFRGGEWMAALQFGLSLPVDIYLFPLISGYVGGDLVAFLFGQERVEAGTLFVDLGTNAELALFDGQSWQVTSVAAGPAFEGGDISCGMARRPGAVDNVELVGDRLRLNVVGDGPPRGICGSGLAAAVAAGREGGLIDAAGTLSASEQVPTNLARYLAVGEGGPFLRLYRDASVELVLTQDDIRAFQLAKGAVRAGITCLLEKSGLNAGQLSCIVVTGAFGSALERASLKKVAMLPENMLEKVRFEADGPLRGVCRFLSETGSEDAVRRLAAALRPYPLSGTPAFEKAFIAALNF